MNKYVYSHTQGRANPGVQGVPCTREAEIKGGGNFVFFLLYDRVVYQYYAIGQHL